jgi:hypothetical protein
MSLTTTFPDHIVIADSPENIVFGTCMLGETFGSVESASIKRASDLEELKGCGNKLFAAILSNPRFEMTLKTLFTTGATEPVLGGTIDFPIGGIKGRILDWSVDWEKAGQRMLNITATSWDHLSVSGSGYAVYYNPGVDFVSIA